MMSCFSFSSNANNIIKIWLNKLILWYCVAKSVSVNKQKRGISGTWKGGIRGLGMENRVDVTNILPGHPTQLLSVSFAINFPQPIYFNEKSSVSSAICVLLKINWKACLENKRFGKYKKLQGNLVWRCHHNGRKYKSYFSKCQLFSAM